MCTIAPVMQPCADGWSGNGGVASGVPFCDGRRVEQRRPARVRLGRRVAVGRGLTDRRDRTPEVPVVLVVAAADRAVAPARLVMRRDGRCPRCRARGLPERTQDAIPDRGTVVLPEDRGLGLVGGARRARERAEPLDLVEVPRVGPARQAFGRSVRSISALGTRNGSTFATHGAGSSAKLGGDGRQTPGVVADDERERPAAAVALAGGEHRGAAAASPTAMPAVLPGPFGDRRQRCVVLRLERRWLRREQCDEDAEGRRRGGRVGRVRRGGRGRDEVRTVAPVDRVDGVVDGALDHREAQRRGVRRLSCSRDDRGGRDRVPVGHGVCARWRGGGKCEKRRGGREQASAAHVMRVHVCSFELVVVDRRRLCAQRSLTFCLDVLMVLLLPVVRIAAAKAALRAFQACYRLFQLLAFGPEADGVPDPGTARGVGRGRRGFPGRPQAARAACRAPAPPERGGFR